MSGLSVQLRHASLADIPTIRAIAYQAWPEAYAEILSQEQLAYMLGRMYSESALREQMEHGHLFLLVFVGDTAVGFAGYELNYLGRGITRLHKLYLHPDHKRKGYGRTLLDKVFSAASEVGDRAVNLNVNKHNPSLGFYQHLGFARIGEEVIDIGGGFVMDDFILERPVSLQ